MVQYTNETYPYITMVGEHAAPLVGAGLRGHQHPLFTVALANRIDSFSMTDDWDSVLGSAGLLRGNKGGAEEELFFEMFVPDKK